MPSRYCPLLYPTRDLPQICRRGFVLDYTGQEYTRLKDAQRAAEAEFVDAGEDGLPLTALVVKLDRNNRVQRWWQGASGEDAERTANPVIVLEGVDDDDGEVWQATLDEFIVANADALEDDEIADIKGLAIGESIELSPDQDGGGRLVLKRVANPSARARGVKRGVHPAMDLPLASRHRRWDRDQAVRRLKRRFGMGTPKFAACFMYVGGGKLSDADTYKLPFCDVVGDTLVAVPRALDAIDAVLDGARGGVDGPSSAERDEIASAVRAYKARASREDNPQSGKRLKKPEARKILEPVAKKHGVTVDELARAAIRREQKSRKGSTVRQADAVDVPLAGIIAQTQDELGGSSAKALDEATRNAFADQIATERIRKPDKALIVAVNKAGDKVRWRATAMSQVDKAEANIRSQAGFKEAELIAFKPLVDDKGKADPDVVKSASKALDELCGERGDERFGCEPTRGYLGTKEHGRVPIWRGAETEVIVPTADGIQKIPAQYALVPVEAVIASHNEETFKPTRGYPADLQERDYENDDGERMKVIRQAQSFEPQLVINSNPDAVNGPPIIDKAGWVLGGNSRVMTIKRYLDTGPKGDAGQSQYYVDLERELRGHCAAIGLDCLDDAAYNGVMLVRVLTGDYDRATISALLNRSLTQGIGREAGAVSLGARLPADALEIIARHLEDNELVGAIRADEKALIAALERGDVITKQNRTAFIDAKRGVFSQSGVLALKDALMGALVGDKELLAEASPQSMQLLARLAPPVLAVQALDPDNSHGYAILPDIRLAIPAFVRLQGHDDAAFRDYWNNLSLLDEAYPEVLNDDEPMPAVWLRWLHEHRKTPAKAAAKAMKYLRGLPSEVRGQASLVPGLPPAELARTTLEIPSEASAKRVGARAILNGTAWPLDETTEQPPAAPQTAERAPTPSEADWLPGPQAMLKAAGYLRAVAPDGEVEMADATGDERRLRVTSSAAPAGEWVAEVTGRRDGRAPYAIALRVGDQTWSQGYRDAEALLAGARRDASDQLDEMLKREGAVEAPAPPKYAELTAREKRYRTIYTRLLRVVPELATMDPGDVVRIQRPSSAIMPLTVEMLGRESDGRLRVSVAHNYIQNHDLMRDPDVEFLLDREQQLAEPVVFEQSMPPVYDAVYPAEGKYRPKLMRSLSRFALEWTKNLEEQGHGTAARVASLQEALEAPGASTAPPETPAQAPKPKGAEDRKQTDVPIEDELRAEGKTDDEIEEALTLIETTPWRQMLLDAFYKDAETLRPADGPPRPLGNVVKRWFDARGQTLPMGRVYLQILQRAEQTAERLQSDGYLESIPWYVDGVRTYRAVRRTPVAELSNMELLDVIMGSPESPADGDYQNLAEREADRRAAELVPGVRLQETTTVLGEAATGALDPERYYREGRAVRPEGSAEGEVTFFTNAPEDYDGFGTRTLRVLGQDATGQDVREVAVKAEHETWQKSRYASGLYGALDEEGAKYAIEQGDKRRAARATPQTEAVSAPAAEAPSAPRPGSDDAMREQLREALAEEINKPMDQSEIAAIVAALKGES